MTTKYQLGEIVYAVHQEMRESKRIVIGQIVQRFQFQNATCIVRTHYTLKSKDGQLIQGIKELTIFPKECLRDVCFGFHLPMPHED